MFKLMRYTIHLHREPIYQMRPATQYLKSSPPTRYMVVIDRSGHVVYTGAIDDTPSTRLADVKTAHNYVAAALDAIAAGQPVRPTAARSNTRRGKHRRGTAVVASRGAAATDAGVGAAVFVEEFGESF
jgi:hypothetical protein